MANLKIVKNRIFVLVAIFGLLLSAVSPSLAFSAQNTDYDLITAYDSKNIGGLPSVQQIGVYNLTVRNALASACFFSRNRLLSEYNSTAVSRIPSTSQGWISLFNNDFFSSIDFSTWSLSVFASGSKSSTSSSKITVVFLKNPRSIPNYSSGKIYFQPPIIFSNNISFTRSYVSLLTSSPAGDGVSSSETYFDTGRYYCSNNIPVSVSLSGFDSSNSYILDNSAFTVVIDSSASSYSVFEGVFFNGGIRSTNDYFTNVPICMTFPLFYDTSVSSVTFGVDTVTLSAFSDIPAAYGWYYSNLQAEFFISPTPIPTVLPTLSPTPIVLPYDSSLDLVSDGSTMGFLDTIQGTFDGLQGLAVLTFFGDLITFIYHQSNVFGVLLLFIPLISFIVFLIGRSK